MHIRQGFLGLAQLQPESDCLIDFITFFHANQLAIPATAQLPYPSHHGVGPLIWYLRATAQAQSWPASTSLTACILNG